MSEKRNKKGGAILSKAEFLRAFIFAFCLILLLLFTYMAGFLLLNRGHYGSEGETVTVIDPDEYFKDCQLVESRCLDIGCNYYSRCGDGHYEACRIYDCGSEIGVYTEDAAGEQKTEKQAKPDQAAIAARKESCKGDMAILSDECVAGEEKIKVRIETEGECEIAAFTVIFDGTMAKANTFTTLGDGTYEITALSCGNVSRIVPAAKGGISLEF